MSSEILRYAHSTMIDMLREYAGFYMILAWRLFAMKFCLIWALGRLSLPLTCFFNRIRVVQDLTDNMQGHLRLHFSSEEASDEQVLAIYPTSIRRRILRHLYLDSLKRCWLFNGCRQKFMDAILAAARVELFMPKVRNKSLQGKIIYFLILIKTWLNELKAYCLRDRYCWAILNLECLSVFLLIFSSCIRINLQDTGVKAKNVLTFIHRLMFH